MTDPDELYSVTVAGTPWHADVKPATLTAVYDPPEGVPDAVAARLRASHCACVATYGAADAEIANWDADAGPAMTPAATNVPKTTADERRTVRFHGDMRATGTAVSSAPRGSLLGSGSSTSASGASSSAAASCDVVSSG